MTETAVESPGFTPPENVRERNAKWSGASNETPIAAVDTPVSTVPAADPKPVVADPDPKPVPAVAEAKPVVETKQTIDVDKLKKLATDGQFEDVLRALGLDPAGIKVPSSRFAEFRQWEKQEKAKIHQASQRVLSEQAEVRSLAQQTVKQFEPFVSAKAAWDKGDVETAIKQAFGADIENFSELAVKQKLGQDPEVTQLKRWKEQQEAREAERIESEKKSQAEQFTQRQRNEYCAALKVELKQAEPVVAAAVETFDDFPTRVMQLQLEHYEKTGEEMPAEEAGAKLLETVRSNVERWNKVFGVVAPKPLSSDAAATQPLDTARAGTSPAFTAKKSSKKQAQPAPALPDSELSEDEKRAVWKKRIKQAAIEDGFVQG
jgi:hypothetical protein